MTSENCEKIRQELVAYVDDELDAGLHTQIEAHLAGCEACRLRHDEIVKTIAQLDGIPAAAPAPGLQRRFEQRLDRERKGILGGIYSWFTLPRILVGASLGACLLIGLLVVLRLGGQTATDASDLVIAGHMDLFSDYEAIENLDVLEDLEFIESLDLEA